MYYPIAQAGEFARCNHGELLREMYGKAIGSEYGNFRPKLEGLCDKSCNPVNKEILSVLIPVMHHNGQSKPVVIELIIGYLPTTGHAIPNCPITRFLNQRILCEEWYRPPSPYTIVGLIKQFCVNDARCSGSRASLRALCEEYGAI